MQPVKLNWKSDESIHQLKDFSSVVGSMVHQTGPALRASAQVILPEMSPISNQGSLGSCVANATCDALETLLGLERKEVVQLSRLFVYWNARNYHRATQVDDGTFVAFAFDSLREHGVCLEREWEYNVAEFAHRPPLRAYENADANKITEYYRIYEEGQTRLDQIEMAIRAGHPVVFGTEVGQALFEYSWGSKDLTPPIDSKGGHAMVIVGFEVNPANHRRFYVRNSWGKGYGRDGYCWFDESYITSSQTRDLTVPTRMPLVILGD